MTRRHFPALAVLGLGLAALAWGLASLQMVFSVERAEAVAALDARRTALAFYAGKTVDMKLAELLERSLKRIDGAAADPLTPDNGLMLVKGGRQILPRPIQFMEGDSATATELYENLVRGQYAVDDDPDSPWAQRIHLLGRFTDALNAKDVARIEDSFRDILLQRAVFRLSAAREIPFMLALLEKFVEKSDPDPGLMRALLRDSVPAGPGREKIEGLQRALLNARPKFTRPDFDFLAARIVALSERSGVEHSSFSSMARLEPSEVMQGPIPSGAPPALVGLRWYVKQVDGEPHGILVDLDSMLAEVTTNMVDLGLLQVEDMVELAGVVEHVHPSDSLPVTVRMAGREKALREIKERYRMKTALVVFSGLTLTAALALLALAWRRKERFLAMKSDFVAAVSHELKTPLASARLMAETLERKLANSPEARDYPERMVKQIDGLSFMVENILSFNRLDKGGWMAQKSHVSLEDILVYIRTEIQNRSATPVEMALEGLEGATVEADPEMMTLLFMNLASNAVKHNDKERVRIVARRGEGSGLHILFRDNGPGLPNSEWEMVFTEFYRRKKQDGASSPGNGLGLAICRRIMTEHGGSIRIVSSGAEGTVFELSFSA